MYIKKTINNLFNGQMNRIERDILYSIMVCDPQINE